MQSAISVLSSLLALAPNNYDCLANLGVAYLQVYVVLKVLAFMQSTCFPCLFHLFIYLYFCEII